MRLDLEDSAKGKRIADAIYAATVSNGVVNWETFGLGIQQVLETESPSPSALAQASWHVASVYPHPEWPLRVRAALDAALQVALVKQQMDANAAVSGAADRMNRRSQQIALVSVFLALAAIVVQIFH